MDWDAIGAIGEIVGAVAVVASLVYVGVQLRRGTQATRAATRQAMTDQPVAQYLAMIDPKAVASGHLKTIRGEVPDELERYHLEMNAAVFLMQIENAYYQYRIGLFEPEEWSGYQTALRNWLGLAHDKRQWSRSKDQYSSEYRRLVESILEELATTEGVA